MAFVVPWTRIASLFLLLYSTMIAVLLTHYVSKIPLLAMTEPLIISELINHLQPLFYVLHVGILVFTYCIYWNLSRSFQRQHEDKNR